MRVEFVDVTATDEAYEALRVLLPARYAGLERSPGKMTATICTDKDLGAADQQICTDHAAANGYTVQFLPDV